ncbi:MAG TPA: DUF4416 family protein [bacterium]
MGVIKEPQSVVPVVGLIYTKDFNIEELHEHLAGHIGAVSLKSEPLPFTHTRYYNNEMGPVLTRQWLAFDALIKPDELAALKLWTNELEEKTLNDREGRMVNIDPGIITLSSLILASTKNYSHRIYLSGGIYAEVTLIYKDTHFNYLEWTYPDYREEATLLFFSDVRELLKNSLKEIHDN